MDIKIDIRWTYFILPYIGCALAKYSKLCQIGFGLAKHFILLANHDKDYYHNNHNYVADWKQQQNVADAGKTGLTYLWFTPVRITVAALVNHTTGAAWWPSKLRFVQEQPHPTTCFFGTQQA